MSETIDQNLFVKDERAGEYRVSFSVRGEVTMTIKAGSLQEARETAWEICKKKEFEELDEVHDVDLSSLRKTPAMFLVTRDGKPMKVSHLAPGDEPRAPDERGF